MTMLERALYLESLRLSVFPLAPREKKPNRDWKEYQAFRATRAEITAWWSNGGSDQNIAVACGPVSGVFVVDIDGADGEASLAALEAEHGQLPKTWRVKTGRGRHYWFRDPGLSNTAGKIGDHIDTRGKGGLIVAPGSVHPSGATYEWELGFDPEFTELADLPAWVVAKLDPRLPKDAGPAPAVATLKPIKGGIDNRDQYRIQRYLDATLAGAGADLASTPQGQRNQELNNRAMWLGHFAHYGVYGESAAWAILAAACVRNGEWADPEGGEKRCRATFLSGWAAGTADPRLVPEGDQKTTTAADGTKFDAATGEILEAIASDTAADPGPFPASSFAGQAPKRQWLVQDWLPAQTVTALYGDGGIGKTLLAQQLAAAYATGRQWCGMPVPKGVALGVFCEDDYNELWRRQDDIDRGAIGAQGSLGDLHLWPRVGFDNVLQNFDRDGVGKATAFYNRLEGEIARILPGLLILDTAADIFGGNEIIRSQVNQFVKSALGHFVVKYGVTILLVAHPSLSGMASGSGTSGSTAWNNSVRSRWYLEKPETALPSQRVLTRKKANYASSGDDQNIQLVWESGILTTQPRPDTVDRIELNSLKSIVADTVEKCWDQGTPIGTSRSSRPVKETLPRLLKGQEPALVMRAFAELERDGYVSCQHGNTHKRGYKVMRNVRTGEMNAHSVE